MDVDPEDDSGQAQPFGPWTIAFRAEGHCYTIRDRQTGALVTAPTTTVTTFLHKLFPQFNARAKVAQMSAWSKRSRYPDMPDGAIVTYWSENGQHAADLGTRMHAAIEQYLHAVKTEFASGRASSIADAYQRVGAPTVPPPVPAAFSTVTEAALNANLNSLNDRTGVVALPGHMLQLARTLAAMELIPLGVEKRVYSPTLAMSGSVDALFVSAKTGEHVLMDWKRRREFTTTAQYGEYGMFGLPHCHYSEALLQLNLYRAILEEGVGVAPKRMFITSIHPDAPEILVSEIAVDNELMAKVAALRQGQIGTMQAAATSAQLAAMHLT